MNEKGMLRRGSPIRHSHDALRCYSFRREERFLIKANFDLPSLSGHTEIASPAGTASVKKNKPVNVVATYKNTFYHFECGMCVPGGKAV